MTVIVLCILELAKNAVDNTLEKVPDNSNNATVDISRRSSGAMEDLDTTTGDLTAVDMKTYQCK